MRYKNSQGEIIFVTPSIEELKVQELKDSNASLVAANAALTTKVEAANEQVLDTMDALATIYEIVLDMQTQIVQRVY